MSLIDYTFFIGNKLSLVDVNDTNGRNNVQKFIDIYEPEFLKKALCLDLYLAYADGTAGSGEPDEKWRNLERGIIFTYGNSKLEWIGFKPESIKRSPIANYVWYKWMEDKHSSNSGVGVVQSKPENAEVISYAKKMLDVWSDMVNMIKSLKIYLDINTEIYPEWKFCSCSTMYENNNLLGI